ncbi:hypothetical protein AVEN_56269-1 [Araneus ventricosus]|uniref:Uncharacterized protein n=1 Tax=Araneus ventricosus TaxID=182803 RepID=A0A4Y2FY47_ARAVE|nr:hypothetical protein AVEN_56269-1 [Araneus ventricosus]
MTFGMGAIQLVNNGGKDEAGARDLHFSMKFTGEFGMKQTWSGRQRLMDGLKIGMVWSVITPFPWRGLIKSDGPLAGTPSISMSPSILSVADAV